MTKIDKETNALIGVSLSPIIILNQYITEVKMKEIFVFGSNLAGAHLGGAARTAYNKYGARWGSSLGHYGNSFAIPTLDATLHQLPLEQLRIMVGAFIVYAINHPNLDFKVTRIGCGIAGYDDAVIASMFTAAPSNCHFDLAWKSYLGDVNYWGTF